MSKAVFQGAYSDLKFIRTRQVCQVIIELPLEDGQRFVAAFGAPSPAREVPVAIARLNTETAAAGAPATVQGPPDASAAPAARAAPTNKRAWSDLSYAEQAGIRCTEPRFWKFLSVQDVDGAIAYVRSHCDVGSRAEITKGSLAGDVWADLERAYQLWLNAPAFGAMA